MCGMQNIETHCFFKHVILTVLPVVTIDDMWMNVYEAGVHKLRVPGCSGDSVLYGGAQYLGILS
jgi:hypothetical protein